MASTPPIAPDPRTASDDDSVQAPAPRQGDGISAPKPAEGPDADPQPGSPEG